MLKPVILMVLLAASAQTAVAAESNAAKIAEAQCAVCHGKDGKSPSDPSYPKIAGQYADYLFKALADYQTGARKNAIMGAIAKPLAKKDMQALAAYFASLPGPLTHRR